MDNANLISLVSLIATLAAVAVSSAFTWRATTLARSANQFPVVVNLLAPHRDPEFLRKERYLVEHLHEHDPSQGFDGLPDPAWSYAFEVCEQYHMLGYVLNRRVTDAELLLTQVRHGAIRTWHAVEPFVQTERTIRGGEYSFLNSFERFVRKAELIDVQAAGERTKHRRTFRRSPAITANVAQPAKRHEKQAGTQATRPTNVTA